MDCGQGFGTQRVIGEFLLVFLAHFFDIFGNFLNIFLEFIDIFLNFLDIFLNFSHVFGYFLDVFLHLVYILAHFFDALRLQVDSHLDKNRQVDGLERYQCGENKKHLVESQVSELYRRKTHDKEHAVRNQGRHGANPAGNAECCSLKMVALHASSILDVMTLRAHAYLCKGTAASIPAVLSLLVKRGIDTGDLHVRANDTLGIDDARDIRDRAALRGIDGARVFVIAANACTSEAQNALLKTFEEPAADATFVLITQSPETLLPTLRSRTEPLVLVSEPAYSPVDVAAFLAGDPERRIELLKPLTAADEKDTAGTLAFLSALEHALAAQSESARSASLAAVYMAREYILDKGALRKALLESVALALP